MADYAVRLIQSEDELESLKADWTLLYERVQPRNVFLSYTWAKAWRSHLCPVSTPFILTARSEGRLVGLAAFRLEKRWGFRMLRFLADGRSDYLGFLLAPGHADVADVLLDYLYRHRTAWDMALLRQLSGIFINVDELPIIRGLCQVRIDATVAPYLSFLGSWEDLCASGPRQLRQMKRKVRKFQREGGTVERITGSCLAHMAEAIRDIEAKSWKAGTHAARFQTEREQNWLKQLLAAFGLRDEIEVWIARVNDLPVAFLLNFIAPQRTYYYQGAYDERYGKYSPGGILHYHAIRRTWQENRHEYDFMMGDEAWKTDWANNECIIRHVAFFPKTLSGYLAFLTLVAPRWYFRQFEWAKSVYATWRSMKKGVRRVSRG